MNEISKLYENCGIKIPIARLKIFKDDNEEIFTRPPFTPEKQIELIKLLQRKNGYKFSFSSTNDNSEYLFFAHKDNTPVQDLIVAGDKCYEEALAGFINTLWQDLTEEEKEAMCGILRA